MSEKLEKYDARVIEPQILILRGQKVVLDSELARIYGVPTFRFNEAIKRNRNRFPKDFMFQLTREEVSTLTSQFAMSKPGRGGRRTLPYAFTEHGAVMAANVLRSDRAIQMSVFVVRAFIRMRQLLVSQQDLARKLVDLEKKLTARLDIHETAITEVLRQIMLLLTPPSPEPEPPRKKIGFLVEDRRTSYKSLKQSKVGKPPEDSAHGKVAERPIQSLERP